MSLVVTARIRSTNWSIFRQPAPTDSACPSNMACRKLESCSKTWAGFDLVFRPLEFLLCRRIGLEPFDFLVKGFFDRSPVSGQGSRGHRNRKGQDRSAASRIPRRRQATTFAHTRGFWYRRELFPCDRIESRMSSAYESSLVKFGTR